MPGSAQKKGGSQPWATGHQPCAAGCHVPPSFSIHSPVKVGVITFYMYSLSLRKIKSLPTSTVPGWQGQDRNPDLPQPTLFPSGLRPGTRHVHLPTLLAAVSQLPLREGRKERWHGMRMWTREVMDWSHLSLIRQRQWALEARRDSLHTGGTWHTC